MHSPAPGEPRPLEGGSSTAEPGTPSGGCRLPPRHRPASTIAPLGAAPVPPDPRTPKPGPVPGRPGGKCGCSPEPARLPRLAAGRAAAEEYPGPRTWRGTDTAPTRNTATATDTAAARAPSGARCARREGWLPALGDRAAARLPEPIAAAKYDSGFRVLHVPNRPGVPADGGAARSSSWMRWPPGAAPPLLAGHPRLGLRLAYRPPGNRAPNRGSMNS